jgi:3-phosphoshikimate 1-carboxyvinyltransferase
VRLLVRPGSRIEGRIRVPGDKSIAHRWLMLAATGLGASRITGLPASLDVLATARCLRDVTGSARPGLEVWCRKAAAMLEDGGSTWNAEAEARPVAPLQVEGEGRAGLVAPAAALDCGNSGTTMRLLAGLLAPAPFACELVGDESLSARPMERVAAPLRAMGASIGTEGGHAPLRIDGRPLHGADIVLDVPTAQVKSAILLAGLEADGATTVHEPAPTRDHTERALEALGASIHRLDDGVSVRRFRHAGFEASVPGDLSSAVFAIVAAGVTGGEVVIEDVGLNPSRSRVLHVLRRMGVGIEEEVRGSSLGEPFGRIHAAAGDLRPVRVEADELPLVLDEIPALAALAAHARGDSWFLGAGELRVKESDRLLTIAEGLRRLGGVAAVEGDDLVIGGGGLAGGLAASHADHRIAMALVVAGLGAGGPVEVEGAEAADVSFPGFAGALSSVGGRVEPGP